MADEDDDEGEPDGRVGARRGTFRRGREVVFVGGGKSTNCPG